MHPKISIVLPVYNCEEYLQECLASILAQDFADFEVIAINDGSTDRTGEILTAAAKNDTRIHIYTQPNLGLIKTLTHGISLARSPIIARVDGDDILEKSRLRLQYELIESDPVIGVVCGGYKEISKAATETALPNDSDEIKRSLYITNSIGHGTVMFRKKYYELSGGYRESAKYIEDYDLWIRLSSICDFASIEKIIYYWRINDEGITSKNNAIQQAKANDARRKLWQSKNLKPIEKSTLNAIAAKTTYVHELFVIETRIFIKFIVHGRMLTAFRQFISLWTCSPTARKTMLSHFKSIIRNVLSL